MGGGAHGGDPEGQGEGDQEVGGGGATYLTLG